VSETALAADLDGLVRAFLKARLGPGARLCLGYSGGLDSSVLLHLLADLRHELGFDLTALHVHNGLSRHADAWAECCRLACERLGVPLVVRRVEVVVDADGLEGAARAARYRAFAEQDTDHIVLAHHRDDQAETLLFRLLRGAGAHGLAAMADERAAGTGSIRRPLLAIARETLQAYAAGHCIDHVEDDSNADVALSRNWLRHAVFPLLEQRFPAVRRVIARTSAQLAESAGLLDDLAELDHGQAAAGAGLDLDVLARLGPARARNLLRYWLHRETGNVPSRAWLDDAQAQLLHAGPDRHPELPIAGRVLRRRGGLAVLADAAIDDGAGMEWCWRGESELALGGHGRLHFVPAVGEGLAAGCLPPEGGRLAWRRGGESLRPDCRRPRRTLKNLLREAAVPADARGRLPLLFIGENLVWAAGIGVDCACQAGPGEPGWLISWCPPGR
jgi:tRNA(Ile)-lysidine synthase